MPSSQKTPKCIICGGSDAGPLYPDIVKCKGCGHVFFDRDLDSEALAGIYSKRYFFGDEYHDYLADKEALQKNFRLRLRTLQAFLSPARHKSLLEIGCAYGFFLSVAKKMFDKIAGMDIAEDGTIHAKEKLNLKAIKADLLEYDFGNEKFDVVCMWDTIEHLQNPDLYLKKIGKHMEKGALIAITTGDIDSVCARVRKGKWRLIHPPTHIHYFSRKTLARLLNDNGFDIVYDRYCGFYRSADLAAYRMLALKGRRKVYDILRRMGLTGFNFYLNLYDIMYIIARKR